MKCDTHAPYDIYIWGGGGGGVTPRGYEYQIILNCLQYLQILNAMI